MCYFHLVHYKVVLSGMLTQKVKSNKFLVLFHVG
jgi:hypothetical protein